MLVFGAMAAVGVFVGLFFFGDRAFTALTRWIDPPEVVRQPTEDDPAFMAHIERKVKHPED